jgi:DNA-binding response OmpR family regulator
MAARPVIALVGLAGEAGDKLEDYLLRRGYDVRAASHTWEAQSLLEAGGIDVAVIGDKIAPDRKHELLTIQATDGGPMLLFVTTGAALIDKVLTLEMGAADIVDANVTTRELAARIGGLVARRGKGTRELLALERTTVDLRSAIVMHKSGVEDQLSAGQVALIRFFLSNAGKVLTRDDIVAAAPAENADAFDRSIDSRIVRLRRKLDTDAITTVRGAGYRFDPPA